MAGLVSFAVFWLIFDAWRERKERKEFFKWLGFLSLALGFVVHATLVEQGSAASSIFGGASETVSSLLRLGGYVLISTGLLTDPMPVVPQTSGVMPKVAALFPALPFSLSTSLSYLPPVGAIITSLGYYRRAKWGLERHLYPVARAFLFLVLYELLAVSAVFRTNPNILVANWTAAYGPLWIAEHLLLMVSIVLLGRWVWQYLVKRLRSQLFMIFTSAILLIFLLTTASFTYLLFKNVEAESLDGLSTASRVLQYALDSKAEETLTDAFALAQATEVKNAVAAKDRGQILTALAAFTERKKEVLVVVTSETGQVLLRSDDLDRWGDSLSDHILIRRAILGRSDSSLGTREAALASVVEIGSAAPVRNTEGTIVGTIMVIFVVDNAFMDGLKEVTGLDASLYADNERSATTFVAADGKTRAVGIKEENESVKEAVLKNGVTFQGALSILNGPFLTVFAPLKDADETTVGMLFVGKPQTALLTAAARSTELTFLFTALLMILSIFPAYRIARHLSYQLR